MAINDCMNGTIEHVGVRRSAGRQLHMVGTGRPFHHYPLQVVLRYEQRPTSNQQTRRPRFYMDKLRSMLLYGEGKERLQDAVEEECKKGRKDFEKLLAQGTADEAGHG